MNKGTIGILTGGGDVPGLNPAIRAITIRALRDGYKVVGIRHGWGGLVDYSREKGADNSEQTLPLTEAIVNRAGRTGGDRKSTRLNSSHGYISYAVFCLKKKKNNRVTIEIMNVSQIT